MSHFMQIQTKTFHECFFSPFIIFVNSLNKIQDTEDNRLSVCELWAYSLNIL